jgi:hypothetical protein
MVQVRPVLGSPAEVMGAENICETPSTTGITGGEMDTEISLVM